VHRDSQQWRLDLAGGEGHDGNRGGGVERVVLDDDDGTRFSAVGAARGCGVDVASRTLGGFVPVGRHRVDEGLIVQVLFTVGNER
jgi:hypothetical protein